MVKEKTKVKKLIQVCWSLEDKKTKERELKSLTAAMGELKLNDGLFYSPLERGRGVLKRFQKRVRFYSKTAFVGVLICAIIATSVLYLFLQGKPSGCAKS